MTNRLLPETQKVLHRRSDGAVWSSESPLWLSASQSSWATYVFKTDVRVLGEVGVSVPWAVACCRAPAVPVLMLPTLADDARLQRKVLAQTLDWFAIWKSGNSDQSQSPHRYSSHFFGGVTEFLKTPHWKLFSFTFSETSSCVSMDSSILTTPNPFSTWPKTTCLPSKCDVGTVVMKNWEPLVSGPALAMLRRPTLSCCVKKVTCDTQRKKQNSTKTGEKQSSLFMFSVETLALIYFCCIYLRKVKWNWPALLNSEHLAPSSGLKSDIIQIRQKFSLHWEHFSGMHRMRNLEVCQSIQHFSEHKIFHGVSNLTTY